MICNYCEHYCDLKAGCGICGRYILDGDQIREKEPLCFLHPYFFDMEALPFYHVEPGTPAIQLGTKSCNASCDYCINAHLTIENNDNPLTRYEPAEIVEIAKDRLASSINFGINEITVFLPSAIEVAKAARKEGLLTGCLTNAFMTVDSAHELVENMDMINVSLKSVTDSFYKKSLGLPSVSPVLRNIKLFSESTHLEIITPITQEIGIAELIEMMDFIEELDPEIPWHLFRLFKAHQRVNEKGKDYNETIDFTNEARKRLPFTYFSNFPGSKWVDTCCPKCAHRVIHRISIGACGAKYLRDDLTEKDCCPECGYKIKILRKKVEER